MNHLAEKYTIPNFLAFDKNGGISMNDVQFTSDGMIVVTKSVADILLHRGISAFPKIPPPITATTVPWCAVKRSAIPHIKKNRRSTAVLFCLVISSQKLLPLPYIIQSEKEKRRARRCLLFISTNKTLTRKS